MATTDPSSTMRGPRYAPDDPSLPEPWKPLIDGSTGRLYYWNPETNVTQYERPGSLPPAVKAGEPPLVNVQSEGMHTMQYQQRGQAQLPQGQLMNTLAQPQTHVGQWASQQTAPPRQHLGPHSGTSPHPVHATSEQFRAEMTQHATVQLPPQVGKVPQQQGHPLTQHSTQQGQQAPQQSVRPMPQVQQGTGFQTAPHSTCYQYIPQPTQHMLHQPGMREQSAVLQGPQSSVQPSQYLPQGQQLPLTPENPHSSLQPTHYLAQGQQLPPTQENKVVPGVNNEVERHRGLSINLQQKKPSPQAHHGVEELVHQQHVSISQNRMVSGLMHGQPQNITHGGPGPKLPYDENNQGRSTNDFFVNNSRDVNTMPPQLPKLAPLPIPRNQPEIRSSGFPPQTVMPTIQGRPNDPAGMPMHGAFGQSSSVHHYPDSSFMRPPMPILGPSDSNDLSAAEAYRQKHEVTAMGENVPAPFMTFEAAGLPPEILQEIRFAGFSAPTPIQAQTWPIALMNRDIVAIAKTGSGKTLGYLIPAFIHLRRRHNNPQFGPTVLVLAPTRELATQIQDEAVKFGRSSRVSCTCLYGGAPKGPQLRELERGADIVVATPGRLNDILDMKKIDFRQVSLLVLDEADRMLDMGFEPQIRKIVNEIPPRRQTLMYTATWPKDVVKIASDLLINPVQVNIGSVDELEANKSITQHVELVPEMEKQRRLEQIIRSQERGSKVIIFCSTKKLCDQLAYSLKRFCGALAIHGDKSQGERDWVLNQFRSGKSQVLVATDVAARGLDIRDIRVVINYDFPTGIEDYVHRIGRTGRAGATGVAYTFFSEQDWKYAPDLIKVLEGANQVVPSEIRDIALRGGSNFGKDRAMINRYGPTNGASRWNPADPCDTRDGPFPGRGGMRDGPFPGRGGDSSFRGRGGMSDGGFSARGGMRDGNFGGRGGGREGSFFSPSGGRGGWDRGGRVGDRFGNMDVRGRGRSRGRGRFDSRRDGPDRGRDRDRSRSRSPERVRTWGYSRSRSRSSSRSRRRSYSRSRSRSWSPSRSPRRSYSRSRSRSPSYERTARRPRVSKFDQMAPDTEIPSGSATTHIPPSGGPDPAPDSRYPYNGTGSTGPILDR